MRTVIFVLGLAAATTIVAARAVSQTTEASTAPQATAPSGRARLAPDDEKAIRALVDAFVKNYNAHDAQAIAKLFTVDGIAADDEGNVARGREAIAQVFTSLFKDHPKTQISNTIESVRQAGPMEVVETGTSTVTDVPGASPQKSRYRVIHVKHNGKWLMAVATELPADTWGGEAALDQLQGLVGDWIDESPDALVLTSYRWTDNHRFILGRFTVQVGGKAAMTGSQRIGWDPLKKTIRSWIFDSEGGFAEGFWNREGNAWIVKLAGTTRDGKPASAMRIITPLGKDRMTLQTVDRTVGGQKMPDSDKILIVRRPPPPK